MATVVRGLPDPRPAAWSRAIVGIADAWVDQVAKAKERAREKFYMDLARDRYESGERATKYAEAQNKRAETSAAEKTAMHGKNIELADFKLEQRKNLDDSEMALAEFRSLMLSPELFRKVPLKDGTIKWAYDGTRYDEKGNKNKLLEEKITALYKRISKNAKVRNQFMEEKTAWGVFRDKGLFVLNFLDDNSQDLDKYVNWSEMSEEDQRNVVLDNTLYDQFVSKQFEAKGPPTRTDQQREQAYISLSTTYSYLPEYDPANRKHHQVVIRKLKIDNALKPSPMSDRGKDSYGAEIASIDASSTLLTTRTKIIELATNSAAVQTSTFVNKSGFFIDNPGSFRTLLTNRINAAYNHLLKNVPKISGENANQTPKTFGELTQALAREPGLLDPTGKQAIALDAALLARVLAGDRVFTYEGSEVSPSAFLAWNVLHSKKGSFLDRGQNIRTWLGMKDDKTAEVARDSANLRDAAHSKGLRVFSSAIGEVDPGKVTSEELLSEPDTPSAIEKGVSSTERIYGRWPEFKDAGKVRESIASLASEEDPWNRTNERVVAPYFSAGSKSYFTNIYSNSPNFDSNASDAAVIETYLANKQWQGKKNPSTIDFIDYLFNTEKGRKEFARIEEEAEGAIGSLPTEYQPLGMLEDKKRNLIEKVALYLTVRKLRRITGELGLRQEYSRYLRQDPQIDADYRGGGVKLRKTFEDIHATLNSVSLDEFKKWVNNMSKSELSKKNKDIFGKYSNFFGKEKGKKDWEDTHKAFINAMKLVDPIDIVEELKERAVKAYGWN